MTPESVILIGQEAIKVSALVATPILGSALAVGLLVGMFQAATQINEMTLSFIPKLGVLVLALFIFGPWMLRNIVDFTTRLITNIPSLLG